MLAHKYDDYKDKPEKLNNQGLLLSQPKLDGIRCIASRDGLFTRNGKAIISAPHILEEVLQILDKNPDIIALDGELYNHELKNDFNEIVSIVKKTKPSNEDLEKSKQLMQYHVYDLIHEDNKMLCSNRISLLNDILFDLNKNDKYHYIKYVITILVNNDIDDLYGSYLEQGYEGQMIRKELSLYEHKRSQSLLKRKEFIDEECLILNVIEGKGNRSGMAGNLTLKHPNGNIFDSNIRGNYDFYKELLLNKNKYIGKYATIRYFSLTTDNIPRFPVMITIRDFE
jgi:ATP-dependent DNA ligase